MAKNNNMYIFYVLYSDETWVFDQSERTQGPIYIIIKNNSTNFSQVVWYFQPLFVQGWPKTEFKIASNEYMKFLYLNLRLKQFQCK